MLYGADYFTEDEWVKIDGLIHKGQYVFTSGPPTTNFLEDELMSFDDGKAATPTPDLHSELVDTNELSAKNNIEDPVVDTKKEVENENNLEIDNAVKDQSLSASLAADVSTDATIPASDKPTQADTTSFETPIPQSLEISSDEEPASASEPAKLDSEEHSFDLSSDLSQPPQEPERFEEEPAEESSFDLSSGLSQPPSQAPETEEKPFEELVKRESINRPANGGLAYYSKEQLDELKAFNAGLTKAGDKKKSSKRVQNSYPSPDDSERDPWTGEETYQEPSANHDYPSPATTDEDSRIHNWASGIGSQANTAPATDPKTQMVNDFIRTHGRMPKSVNDIYQPNNSGFTPLTSRPASRATSIRPIKTSVSKSIAGVVATLNPGSAIPHLNVALGTILVAQSYQEAAPGQLRIEVLEGDQIKVLKHVSGAFHHGQNLRTGKSGQFNEAIFRRPSGAQSAASNNTRRSAVAQPTGRVEGFERVNASEWDEVPVTTRARTVAPSPFRPAANGLASSRYAVLADTKSEDSDSVVHSMTREDVDKLVDERVKKLLENGNVPASPLKGTRPPRTSGKIIEPLKKVEPKTATCWFWATPGKDCRFTAEECRDLHAWSDPDPNADPANLRMGKPTWGALADIDGPASPLPAGHNVRLSSHLQGSKAGFTPVESTIVPPNKFTCHFWANGGKCQFSATECKYMHDWSPNGVAKPPSKWNGQKINSWSRWGKERPQGSGNDAWEVKNPDDPVTSWGAADDSWEVTSSAAGAWGQTLPKNGLNRRWRRKPALRL
ncbi:hypothetical protein M7I_7837 [Glarea lozoyensis 74030]|uniref:C3H1-type domain-containing protein n=1 Tax=Glarea lozoyensis (strain ATCC 74030 / MF5533) TaxID=1104152 RepID=H0EYD8_GLAL7|nr:hypothetical protein M7I_7837 [Glarea lozoyensis 74030]